MYLIKRESRGKGEVCGIYINALGIYINAPKILQFNLNYSTHVIRSGLSLIQKIH